MIGEIERHAQHLKEQFEEALVEKVATALGEVSETVYSALYEQLGGVLEHFYEDVSEHIEARMEEEVRDIQNLIVTLADTLSPEARSRFYAKAAKDARQQEPPDDDEYRGARNQDGSAVIGNGVAKENRQSHTPHSRLRESVVDDNDVLRDELLAREKARKERYHDALVEYVSAKDGQSKGVLRG
jgi:site-specific DNA-cytosine methylase